MNRRGVLARCGALGLLPLLAGCGKSETANVRFRVICTVEVDGRKVEGTTVMEVHYTMVTSSLTGMGASSRHIGEALILDLPGRGTVYMLPFIHDGASLNQAFPQGVINSLGIGKGIGALSAADYPKLKAAKGRVRLVGERSELMLPAFVAFKNDKDPKTIYEIAPRQFSKFFPGVKFVNLEIEFTDAPLTHELLKRLPWLASEAKYTTVFPRDPPGQLRANIDTPISHKILELHFFGRGN